MLPAPGGGDGDNRDNRDKEDQRNGEDGLDSLDDRYGGSGQLHYKALVIDYRHFSVLSRLVIEDKDGNTPLMLATYQGHIHTLRPWNDLQSR